MELSLLYYKVVLTSEPFKIYAGEYWSWSIPQMQYIKQIKPAFWKCICEYRVCFATQLNAKLFYCTHIKEI